MDKHLIVPMLRRWGWLIVVATLLVSGTAFAASNILPKTYTAVATLLVQQQASSIAGQQFNDVLYSQQLARTYEKMILTQPVLEQVIAGLGLRTTPEELSKSLTAKLVRDTVLIQISAEDRDPQGAQRLANTVAQTFIEQNRRLAVGSLTTQKENLARQIAKLSGEVDASILMVERLRGLASAVSLGPAWGTSRAWPRSVVRTR